MAYRSLYKNKIDIPELKLSTIAIQGMREHMEDENIFTELNISGHYLAAVFDGHGGNDCSKILKDNFIICMQTMVEWKKYQETGILTINFFKDFYELLDDILRILIDKSGSTATVILITPLNYYFVNLGDSRSCLIEDNIVKFSTYDHKPTVNYERDRIIFSGGYVYCGRVNGILALSRAFGDFYLKNHVSCIPFVDIIERKSKHILILASDGLWDYFTCQDISNRINEIFLNIDHYRKIKILGLDNYFNRILYDSIELEPLSELEKICFINEILIEDCVIRGAEDNITLTLILII